MNSAQWDITPETITHIGKPGFTAHWFSGEPDFENISGLFWYEGNSGSGDDTLLIFDFEWHNGAPDQAVFEKLMKSAESALDAWISKCF
ncbi:MAG: hypothetical protein OEY89_16735 [Gammaproteobacteria bacterium]|nr:hypothetical protein [Gammaproteobacteria bacterium]